MLQSAQWKKTYWVITLCCCLSATIWSWQAAKQSGGWWRTAQQQAWTAVKQNDLIWATHNTNPDLAPYAGSVLFAHKKYQAAADQFSRNRGPEAQYNAGVALMQHGAYAEAITAFDRALYQRSTWIEARENRKLAALRLAMRSPPQDDAPGMTEIGSDGIADSPRDFSGGDQQQTPQEASQIDQDLLQQVKTSPADFLKRRFARQAKEQQLNKTDQAHTESEEP